MKAISLQTEQSHCSLGKHLLRALKVLVLTCVLASQPLASRAAGVTIITHGFQLTEDGESLAWLDSMAVAMAERAGGIDRVPVYKADINSPLLTSDLELTLTKQSGPDAWSSANTNGEVVLKIDWTDVAGLTELVSAGIVAEKVVEFLNSNNQWIKQPIHLVGHSRGAILVLELARLLGEKGIIVDQLTTLDLHPMRKPLTTSDFSSRVDPYPTATIPYFPKVYENVFFADNYYQEWPADNGTGEMGGLDGWFVSGAQTKFLNHAALNQPGTYLYEHSDVHLWYFGTVNTAPTVSNGDKTLTPEIRSAFYIGESSGATAGFYFSRIGNGERPQAGISSQFGGDATDRNPVTTAGSQWPNVLIHSVTDTSVTAGSPLEFSCWYRDTDSGGAITVYLDDNQNPYDSFPLQLKQESYSSTSSSPMTRNISASTAGATSGTYYLCTKITDSTGRVRYDYWREPIVIASIGVLVQMSPNDQGLDFIVDGTSYSSQQTFQWQDGIAHDISVAGYQTGDNNAAYGFKQWSDGITTTTRSIQPSGNVTYTAIFTNNSAATLTATPSADTTVRQASPDSDSYKNDQAIWIRESPATSESQWGLLKFNLSSIPAGSAISEVELKLNIYLEDGAAGPVYLRRVLQSWDENQTWNTRPDVSTIVGAQATDPGDATLTFQSSTHPNLALIVQGFVTTPSQNFGFSLHSGKPSTETIAVRSSEYTAASGRPRLVVHYTPPPDTTGDPIVNLIAKKSSTGSTITANNWQHDNDPYFSWSTANTVYPIIGYSFILDNPTPDNTVDVTVPYYQYSSDSISDGLHTFYVKSLDANGNWGPVASFVIKVDANPPTSGTITVNDGATSTWSPIVTLNNLGASAVPSGLDQMKFSNDGSNWTAYESYTATKAGWDLYSNGGSTNVGTKTVYVRYKDNAGNESAIFSDTISFDPAPRFTSQPASFGVARGLTHVFAATVEGYEPLSYQWRFNGVDVPGATLASLTVTNASPTNAGQYSVVVSNAFGAIESTNVRLAIVAVAAWGEDWAGETHVPLDLTNAVAIAAGASHSLALKPDGMIVAWGNNEDGQCDVPLGLSNVTAIAAGDHFSMALKADGTVVCWGLFFSYGESSEAAYVPEGVTGIVAVAAGGEHCLALDSGGQVYSWGAGYPVSIHVGDAIAVFQSGVGQSLAIRADGTVTAWGTGYESEWLPEGLTNVVAVAAGPEWRNYFLTSDGTIGGWWHGDGTQEIPSFAIEPDAVALSVAQYDSCLVLKGDGQVAWYSFGFGFECPSGLKNVAAISSSEHHNLALIKTGPPILRKLTVPSLVASSCLAVLKAEVFGESPLYYQWQWNGQDLPNSTNSTLLLTNIQLNQSGFYSVIVSNALGVASSVTNELTVVPVLIVEQPASQVGYLGNELNLSVTVQGAGPLNYQWLFNGAGISGATNETLVFTNLQFSDSGDYSVVVTNLLGSATSHLASLTVSMVVPWGYYDPSNGLQLMTSPTGLTNVVAIAAGANHALLLQSDGLVKGWGGYHHYDEETETESILPVNVPESLNNVTAIAAGGNHSLALRADGTVAEWNDLGLVDMPTGVTNVMAIAVGEYHSLALSSDGAITAWGDDSQGQLDVPAGLSNVVAIAAGPYHNLALGSDGTVSAWGGNWSGQTEVPEGLSNVVAIAGGWSHSFALKADGTTVFWGDFESGGPHPPDDLENIIAIASGPEYCLALHNDGTLEAWGSFYDNWTGDNLPIAVPQGLKSIVSLAGGSTFGLALLGDGGPVMARQPINRTILAGQQIVLNAMAGGSEPLTYQWQFNGTNIIGGTDAILIINPARVENAGYYSVIVSNSHGMVVGGPWLVMLARPANDNFENRETVASDFGFTDGNNLDATKEVGENYHSGVAGGSSVWWTWTPSRAGTATITTDGSSFDTVLAVYTGGNVGGLALVAANDDQNGSVQSKVVFPVLRGVSYHIVVDGKQGSSGNIILTRSFEGPHLTEVSVLGNTAQFILNGPSGYPYQLQISSNLVDWVSISNVTIPESGSVLLGDQTWSAYPKRFYRVNFDERSYGLVAHYPLNGDAEDASPNGNDGVVNGAIPVQDRFGNPNSAFAFGNSWFVNCGNSPGLQFVNSDFTISVWVKRTNVVTNAEAAILTKDGGVGVQNNQFRLHAWNSIVYFEMTSSSGSEGLCCPYKLQAELPSNVWTHISVVRSGLLFKLYVDGNLKTNATSLNNLPQINNANLLIGARYSGVNITDFFPGQIDDVWLYNRALSASEIQQLYLGQ